MMMTITDEEHARRIRSLADALNTAVREATTDGIYVSYTESLESVNFVMPYPALVPVLSRVRFL